MFSISGFGTFPWSSGFPPIVLNVKLTRKCTGPSVLLKSSCLYHTQSIEFHLFRNRQKWCNLVPPSIQKVGIGTSAENGAKTLPREGKREGRNVSTREKWTHKRTCWHGNSERRSYLQRPRAFMHALVVYMKLHLFDTSLGDTSAWFVKKSIVFQNTGRGRGADLEHTRSEPLASSRLRSVTFVVKRFPDLSMFPHQLLVG